MSIQQVLLALGSTYVFNATISANTNNYNLRAAAVAAGWDQIAQLQATITINSGVVVGSTSTANPAFDTGVTFPAGSKLSLINNGYIVGRGGQGGYPSGAGSNNGSWPEQAGGSGGLALKVQAPIDITNNGTIGGGGGGGGGGGANSPAVSSGYAGGGGGGAGSAAGTGNTSGGGSPGGTGTLTTGGSGSGGGDGGNGGDGGGLGVAGGTGASGNWHSGASGGSPGAAVNGNSNITWVTTGTRLGVIA